MSAPRSFLVLLGLLLLCQGCSFLEKTETRKFELSWEVKHEEKSDGQSLVEFEFVNFPGHIIGEYSNTLIKHLEANGTKEITVVVEITNSVLRGDSCYVVSIDGKKWSSVFGYLGVRGDPERSPFE